MVVGLIIVVVAIVGWGVYGYMKGAPHGLGAEGSKLAMTGIFGMPKPHQNIEKTESSGDSRPAGTS